MKISIDGTDFEMEYGWCSNGEATIKCKTKDVEFLSVPYVSGVKRIIDRDITPNTYNQFCRHQFNPYLHNESMEPKAPLDVVKKAVKEVLKENDKISSIDVTAKSYAEAIKSAEWRIFKKIIGDIEQSGGD